MPIYNNNCQQKCIQQALRTSNQCSNCCRYAICPQGSFLTGCNNRTVQCQPCQNNCKICHSPWTCGQCKEDYCLTGGTMSYCVLCPPDCLKWEYSAQCVLWKAPKDCVDWESHKRICYKWENKTNSLNSTIQAKDSSSSNSSLIIGLVVPLSIFLILILIYVIYKFKKRGENYEIPNEATESSASSINDCAICLGSLSEGQVITTGCRHIFHNICLRQWITRNNICPMCRRIL